MKKIIARIKLFFFHLWWGKNAFRIIFTDDLFEKGDVCSVGDTDSKIIFKNNGKWINLNECEYVVCPLTQTECKKQFLIIKQ